MSAANAAKVTVKAVQGILSLLAGLHLNGLEYGPSAKVMNETKYDFVVIGGGTAGCVVASRLTEDPNTSVLLIEAGSDPTIETEIPYLFPLFPRTNYDYNFATVNDNYTAQNLQDNIVRSTAGKMLGGSSGLEHLIQVRGSPYCFNLWASATNDSSWNFDNLLPYFKKSEDVQDVTIFFSNTSSYHGYGGNLKQTREPNKLNQFYIEAHKELGLDYVLDFNGPKQVGISESLFFISKLGKRQSTANSYITPAKDRQNLFVWKQATVTKILIDENNNAIGATVLNSNGDSITVYANKEVVLSAGAFKSPQLLLLSGVGPKSELDKWNIPVKSDLPVGENLQDHVAAVILFKTKSTSEIINLNNPNLFEFPAPFTMTYQQFNPEQSHPDYQSLNLIFTHDSPNIPLVATSVFKYSDAVVNDMFKGNVGRQVMFSVISKGLPYSRGHVRLNSLKATDDPEIYLGLYSNKTDLDDMARNLQDFARLKDTKTFESVDSDIVEINLPKCDGLERGSLEYWRCYALELSATIWHTCGTNAMGSVLDSNLQVRGVNKLRVIDASSMPNIVDGNIMSAVVALAEKGADLIKSKYRKPGLFGF